MVAEKGQVTMVGKGFPHVMPLIDTESRHSPGVAGGDETDSHR